MKNCLILFWALFAWHEVNGHGRLMDPPARNSMWRQGFTNPANYNDNELNCGGATVHHLYNKGKCGLCGDNYRQKSPRQHEAGGEYGNGIITRTYSEGQVIEIVVHLTANHIGYMTIELCSHNKPKEVAKDKCFRYLEVVGGRGRNHKFDVSSGRVFTWKVKLPPHLHCSQCILRWTYTAGNNWGICSDGRGRNGCGNQETFINCADVEIRSNSPNVGINHVGINNVFRKKFHKKNSRARKLMFRKDFKNATEELSDVIMDQVCLPKQEYANKTGIEDSCRLNCLNYLQSNCNRDACKCYQDCEAVGDFASRNGSNIYCQQYCLTNPPSPLCREDRCKCF